VPNLPARDVCYADPFERLSVFQVLASDTSLQVARRDVAALAQAYYFLSHGSGPLKTSLNLEPSIKSRLFHCEHNGYPTPLPETGQRARYDSDLRLRRSTIVGFEQRVPIPGI
jgi:hypothetical protein